MNEVRLIGRLVNNSELKRIREDLVYVKNAIAVKREFKNKEGNYETDFFDFIVFRQDAEFLYNYVKKGDLFLLKGYLQNNSYEKDGQRFKRLEIMGEHIELLSSNQKEEKAEKTQSTNEIDENDILPF